MIYYFVPIYTFVAYIFYTLIKSKQEIKIVWWLCFLLPIIIFISYLAIFRDISIGTDTLNYRNLFYSPEEDLEIGFRYLSEIVKYFGGDFRLFLSIFFIIAFFTKLFSFVKGSYSTLICILIYSGMWFLVYDMNGIRQGVALGFICVSYYFIFNNRTILAILFFCFGGVFHYTVVVFLPFLFIVNWKCTDKRFFLILGVSIFLASINFTEIIVDLISKFQYLNLRLIDRVISYQNDELFNSNAFYSFKTISRLIILFFSFFIIKIVDVPYQYKNIILWGMLLHVVLFLLFSQYEVIATRLSLYYRLSELYFFSIVPLAFKGKLSKIIVVGLLCIYTSLNIYQTLSMPDNNLSPYKSTL